MKNAFYTYTLGKYWQIKTKQSDSGHFTFWNCYIQGSPRKKQSHCFFHRESKTSRKLDFGGCPLDELQQIRKKLESGHYTFWN